MSDFNLGTVTAYGYAKDKGYTGTEDEFAALMASYADVAEQAAESATQAAASATTARTKASEAAASATAAASSKTAAETAQSGAETAAQTATTKAGEASASATTASGKATEATTAAGTATTKASEATTAATTATTKAGEASTSATNAAASATRAQEILDSIPADYSQLSDDVEDLKDGLTAVETDALAAYATDTATGAIASFSDGADGVPVKSLVVNIEPVQSGSGDPSPDNVRPISGHTSAVVTRTGVNVWDEEWVNGRWAGNQGVLNPAFTTYVACKNKISVKPNTTYYFTVSGSMAKTREIVNYDANGNWLSDVPSVYQDATFTTPSGCYYITFNLGGAYGATYNHDVAINLPSTDHDYHAYNGQTVTIDLNGGSTGTDITTIKGQNNIWADIGDVEVEYRADTKLYINKVLNA